MSLGSVLYTYNRASIYTFYSVPDSGEIVYEQIASTAIMLYIYRTLLLSFLTSETTKGRGII